MILNVQLTCFYHDFTIMRRCGCPNGCKRCVSILLPSSFVMIVTTHIYTSTV